MDEAAPLTFRHAEATKRRRLKVTGSWNRRGTRQRRQPMHSSWPKALLASDSRCPLSGIQFSVLKICFVVDSDIWAARSYDLLPLNRTSHLSMKLVTMKNDR